MNRVDIQSMLEDFQKALNEKPSVYFQPPDSAKLSYPCFIYSYSDVNVLHSDGDAYLKSEEYVVKYITKKADPKMFDALLRLNSFRFDRHYLGDGLHHYSFVLSTPLKGISEEIDLRSIEKQYL